MKEIRIFVASSKELEQERNELAFLVLEREEAFAARGLRVRLAKWEYVDPKMTEGRTEDRYLDEMYDCDAAFVLFRDIAGMYTREELDKALAMEREGTMRLKAHTILFAADGKPGSEAARLRALMPEGSYGVWSSFDELREQFLVLVDRVARCEGLMEVPDEHLRTVSAFIAADDELVADRAAFADSILNLNDILARRGFRVRLRFYDPALHRETLDESEMALVLYYTNCNAFGPEQMRDAYERTKREENPKRLYVFFRDADDTRLDPSFVEFKKGFAENLGHFFCRFENADTLKLNFLLSLENILGDGESFVKLDGTKVKADDWEVGEITKLPMVAHNDRLSGLLENVRKLEQAFDEQSLACRNDPNNEELYVKLLQISTKKNELEGQVNKELSQSFDLARRMAAISAKEANETIARARMLLDQGNSEEALELLDGPSSSLDDILGSLCDTDDILNQQLAALEAQIDVQKFRVDTILAYAKGAFAERFAKAEEIYKTLLAKTGKMLMSHRPEILAKLLKDFASLYDKTGNDKSPIPLLDKALKIYRSREILSPGTRVAEIALVLMRMARCHKACNMLPAAESEYGESLGLLRSLAAENPRKHELHLAEALVGFGNLKVQINSFDLAEEMYAEALGILRKYVSKGDSSSANAVAGSLMHLARLHMITNRLKEAESEYTEALAIVRSLSEKNPGKYLVSLASSLSGLGHVCQDLNRLGEAEKMYGTALLIRRRLAQNNPAKFDEYVAASLDKVANLHQWVNRLGEAEVEYAESLAIRRRLVQNNPAKFDEYVAASLNNLANLHQRANRIGEAEREYGDSLAIYRRLAQNNPAKFDEYVAVLLNNLSNLHKDVNRLGEAEREYGELLAINRRLAQNNPAKFDEAVARSLNKLANLHKQVNRLIEAEEEYAESLAIRRRLAAENPAKFSGALAGTLHGVGILRTERKSVEEADKAFSEALSIYRELATANPDKYDSSVANTLVEFAKLHRDFGKSQMAAAEYAESLEIRRRLAIDNPEKFNGAVSETLTGIAVLHTNAGKFTEAEAEFTEAFEIREELAAKQPAKYNKDLAETLHEQAKMLLKKGDLPKAKAFAARAYDLRKQLSAEHPERYAKDLAETEKLITSIPD